jgi:acetylornithine deacetylase/succinyl-diaminopimelate desuccinylase-like protein
VILEELWRPGGAGQRWRFKADAWEDAMGRIYVVGTADTKGEELAYLLST